MSVRYSFRINKIKLAPQIEAAWRYVCTVDGVSIEVEGLGNNKINAFKHKYM